MDYEYDVALSFAGENRDYVEKVAGFLREHGIKVFYDRYNEVELWGKDLYSHLDDIYRKKSRYCVMFLSEHYAKKLWANHERESSQARAFSENSEYILPVRFDNTEIPGVRPTTGYIDLAGKTPVELGGLILAKITQNKSGIKAVVTETFRKPRIVSQAINPYAEAIIIIGYIKQELIRRGKSIEDQGVSLTVFDREGRSCFRFVHNGKTKYALDIWMGGFTKDSSINFYNTSGEPSFPTSSINAWGDVVWDNDKQGIFVELNDLSFLENINSGKKKYSKKEFVEALWNKICNALESHY